MSITPRRVAFAAALALALDLPAGLGPMHRYISIFKDKI